jgi:DNA-binding transcriptional ArsR family regulator
MKTLIERTSSEKLNRAAEMLKTMAHPVRLAIIDLIKNNSKMSNTDIQNKLKLEQPILSQHLTLMRDKGIIDFEKSGKYSFYYLKQNEFMKIIDCVENCCEKL